MSDLSQTVADLERRVRALEHPVEIRLQAEATELVLRPNGVVVYSGGKAAAALTVRPEGSVLTLFAACGQPAAGIDVLSGSAALRLFDPDGQPRVEIQVVDGVPELYLLGASGNRLAELDGYSGSSLSLSDNSGQVRVQLSVSKDGAVSTRLK